MNLIKGVLSQLEDSGETALPDDLVITVDTSVSLTFIFPFNGTSSQSYTVFWGDGDSDIIPAFNASPVSHVFSEADVFEIIVRGQMPQFYFNDGGSKLVLKTVEQWGSHFFNFNRSFYGCANLESIPQEPMPDPSSGTANRCFTGCLGLQIIPSDLLDNFTNVDVGEMFYFSGITSIPNSFGEDSSVYNTSTIFRDCWDLVTVGDNVFAGCLNNNSFVSAFQSCHSLETVGINFGRACANDIVSTQQMFYDCENLISVGSGFLADNSGNDELFEMFRDCVSLVADPLLTGLTTTPNFQNTFLNCSSMVGNVDEYWVDYPSASPVSGCFTGATNLDNYGDIPSAWGGGGA